MTGLQKFIKYVAIVFGIYLSITIVWIFLGIAKDLVDSSKDESTNLVENTNTEDYNNYIDFDRITNEIYL